MTIPHVTKIRICNRCGRCCKKGGNVLEATNEDLERWKREGRTDILGYADIFHFPELGDVADLWFDSRTHTELHKCPFLKKINYKEYICLIHDTKPEMCKEYFCEERVK